MNAATPSVRRKARVWRWSEAVLGPKSGDPPNGPPATLSAELPPEIHQLLQLASQRRAALDPLGRDRPLAAKGRLLKAASRGPRTAGPAPRGDIALTGTGMVSRSPSKLESTSAARTDTVPSARGSQLGKSTSTRATTALSSAVPSSLLSLQGPQTTAELAVINHQKQVQQYLQQASVNRKQLFRAELPSVFRDF